MRYEGYKMRNPNDFSYLRLLIYISNKICPDEIFPTVRHIKLLLFRLKRLLRFLLNWSTFIASLRTRDQVCHLIPKS